MIKPLPSIAWGVARHTMACHQEGHQAEQYKCLGCQVHERSFLRADFQFRESRVRAKTFDMRRTLDHLGAARSVRLSLRLYDVQVRQTATYGSCVWARPEELEDLTLYRFASDYVVESSAPAEGPSWPVPAGSGTRFIRPHNKAAVLRIYPRLSPEAHGDDYYYSLLL